MNKHILYVIILLSFIIAALPALGIEQQALAQEQKVESATNIVIKYFELLCSKNVVGIPHLTQMHASIELVNPISKTERDSSSITFTYASQLDNLIAKGKQYVDLARIKDWAGKKIVELEKAEDTRKQVHENTREIHRQMHFVQIPAGKYKKYNSNDTFELPEIEIQDNLITQYQWARIMEDIQSLCINHESADMETVEINGKKLKMRPDASACDVSYMRIQKFIDALNKQDDTYVYTLPSVNELLALQQITLGEKWHRHLQSMNSNRYFEIDNQRLWTPISSTQQCTRDWVQFDDKEAHLVFGLLVEPSQNTAITIKDLLHSVIYDASRGPSIGLRLVRYKKSQQQNPQSITYSKDQLSWNENDLIPGSDWYFNKVAQKLLFKEDSIRWLIDHKQQLPQNAQGSINKVIANLDGSGRSTLLGFRRLNWVFTRVNMMKQFNIYKFDSDIFDSLVSIKRLGLIELLDSNQKTLFKDYFENLIASRNNKPNTAAVSNQNNAQTTNYYMWSLGIPSLGIALLSSIYLSRQWCHQRRV